LYGFAPAQPAIFVSPKRDNIFFFFNHDGINKPVANQTSIMKKVSLLFAMLLGFVATSFAQIGQADCAWNAQYVQPSEKKDVMSFYDIVPLGISNDEGDPAYSVSLTANFKLEKSSNVVLTETKTGKKWLMSQVTPMSGNAPAPCLKGELTANGTHVHRSNATNLVVYVTVSPSSGGVFVYIYKPANQNFKAKL
jgi:hypothetical protein